PRPPHSFPTRRSSDLVVLPRLVPPLVHHRVLPGVVAGVVALVPVDVGGHFTGGEVVVPALLGVHVVHVAVLVPLGLLVGLPPAQDRKSTRLNSSHVKI